MNAKRSWVAELLPGRDTVRELAREPRKNLFAGLIVAIVALPLALGFGVSSGLGPAAGLTTAIVAGAIAAVFGGSNLQVTGPTGAMTVILVPIAQKFGAQGVLAVGFLAGLMLLGLAVARAGQLIQFVPAPVVEGFTVGIAFVIFLQQVPAALGVTGPAATEVSAMAWESVTTFAVRPHWAAVALAVFVAVAMLAGYRWRPTVPFSLIAVAIATVVALVLDLDVARIGALPATLPAPSAGFLQPSAFPSLVLSAVAVAMLGALESLLSAKVADDKRPLEAPHNPHRELFGQGLSNIVTPLFGGVPATAAIARTAVNVRSGATSRLAALSHAVILAVIMLGAAPLVAHIPLAALAGVLLATAVRMIELTPLTKLARSSTSDAVIVAITAACTLFLDLMAAVGIGLGATILVTVAKLLVRMVRATIEHDAEADPGILAYTVSGPLIFFTVGKFRRRLKAASGASLVRLRLSGLTLLDSTGAICLRQSVEELRRGGTQVEISGLRDEDKDLLQAHGLLAGD